MFYYNFASPIGSILLVGKTNKIYNLYINTEFKMIEGSNNWIKSEKIFTEAKNQLVEYFEGRRKQFRLNLMVQGTSFQSQVWKELYKIPYGGVRSYKQIATAVGNSKAYRAVGMANNKNPIPIIIPCHRVIRNDSELGGYASGRTIKSYFINLEKIHMLFEYLSNYYAIFDWWKASSEFEIMVGAILTQNSRWENVTRTLNTLKKVLTPQQLIKLPLNILTEMIASIGFYKQKAKTLLSLSCWLEQYNFDFEKLKKTDGKSLRNELLLIKGIGPETADSILTYSLNKPFFIIDTYTKRILQRIGIYFPKAYEQFRLLIEGLIPRNIELYKEYHGLIVEHAKLFCRKKPHCSNCPVNKICDRMKG